jgi:hypothetical protein
MTGLKSSRTEAVLMSLTEMVDSQGDRVARVHLDPAVLGAPFWIREWLFARRKTSGADEAQGPLPKATRIVDVKSDKGEVPF